MALTLGKAELDEIVKHALETYPYECCGLLIRRQSDRKIAVKAVRSSDVHEGNKRTRYMLDPLEFYRAEKEAEKEGLTVVGVYHSHPDYPPKPSAHDAEEAWPTLSYLIVSVSAGRINSVASWTYDDKKKEFTEEDLTIV